MSRTPENIQDELLVLRCQAGDADALRVLIERWQPRFGRFAWHLTNDREATRDVVQDAWMAIVRGIKRLDDPALFRSWAYRIVSNKCADWLRQRIAQRGLAQEPRVAPEPASREPDSSDEVEPLRRALRRLPDEQRAILSLHYLDGMSVAEIARVMDVPTGTVKSRLHHARNRLKTALERIET